MVRFLGPSRQVHVSNDLDPVARYGASIGFQLRRRNVLVEGSTDVDLFRLAARLEERQTGSRLLEPDLNIVAAGDGDKGGAGGVGRELMILRNIARTCLTEAGAPRYRFIGLFDNDEAGRKAIVRVRGLDNSLLEFKDLFRLWPVMPTDCNLDPGALQKAFLLSNASHKGLDWEIEDYLSDEFVEQFCVDHPTARARIRSEGGRTHRDFTRDGKARLHRFIRENAIFQDVKPIVGVIKALRFYLGLR